MKHLINDNKIEYSESTKGKRNIHDFRLFENWAQGLGLEIGCGMNRFSHTVLAIDRSKESEADIIIDANKLPFADRTFDFIFSSHCLKDFSEPLLVFKEWLRVIKPMGFLLLLLPDMDTIENWGDVAGFKCTETKILKLIEQAECRLIDMPNHPQEELTTSFAIVIQRLPVKRDEYKLVYTQLGRALLLKENNDEVEVMYADGSTRILNKNEIRIDGTYRFPDLLDMLGGKTK